MGEENLRDDELEERWKQFPFQKVQWENLNARHTIFDAYETFDHSVSNSVHSNEILSDRLTQLAAGHIIWIGKSQSNISIHYMLLLKLSIRFKPQKKCPKWLCPVGDLFKEKGANVLYPPKEGNV